MQSASLVQLDGYENTSAITLHDETTYIVNDKGATYEILEGNYKKY